MINAISSYQINTLKPTFKYNQRSMPYSLNQLQKDSFTPSFKGGYKFPINKIEELGNNCAERVAQKADLDSKLETFIDYIENVREAVSNTHETFLEKANRSINAANAEKVDKDSITKFVSDCSHEATGSYLSIAQEKMIDPDEALSIKEQISISDDAVRDGIKHVNDTFKRYQFFIDNNMHREDSTIGGDKVFGMVIDAFKEKAEMKNIKLVVEGEALLKKYANSINCDYKKYIIESNLLGNAIKYSPKNSTINLGFKIKDNDNHLYFFIKDQGIGILEKDKKNVLNQSRGSNVGNIPGTGYGLYRTSYLAKQLGGNIEITSPLYPTAEIYKGTMFETPVIKDVTNEIKEKRPELAHTF